MATARPIKWNGAVLANCQTCATAIDKVFYDAKTKMGPWAIMCPSCFTLGPGYGKLGLGFGQQYTKQADGTWLKTGG